MVERTIVENVFLTINLFLVVGGLVGVGYLVATTELTVGKGILLFMILLAIGSVRVSYKSPDDTSNTEVSGIVNKLEQKK